MLSSYFLFRRWAIAAIYLFLTFVIDMLLPLSSSNTGTSHKIYNHLRLDYQINVHWSLKPRLCQR